MPIRSQVMLQLGKPLRGCPFAEWFATRVDDVVLELLRRCTAIYDLYRSAVCLAARSRILPSRRVRLAGLYTNNAMEQ